MLCQNCGKNEATTHIKQVINGDTAERHLCSECAEHLATATRSRASASMLPDFSGISSAMQSIRSARRERWFAARNAALRSMISSARAESAARSATKFFYNELKPSLQRIHGQIHHSGKIASTAEPVSEEEAKIDEKEELKKQMDEAVAAQNFELAAQLRDRIKELEGGNENE